MARDTLLCPPVYNEQNWLPSQATLGETSGITLAFPCVGRLG